MIFASARVRGFQGSDLSDPNTILACAKHFAGYGYVEAGRDYNTTEISINTLHNVVLPPFKAAANSGVGTFMNSFNDLNGIPSTADKFLQRDILKELWKFKGFVVRGNRNDYERWENFGLKSWSYDKVLPYFKKIETWSGGENQYRGSFGPLTVNQSKNESSWQHKVSFWFLKEFNYFLGAKYTLKQ